MDTSMVWAVGLIALALGIAFGFLVAIMFTGSNAKVREMERELEGVRGEFGAYKDQVKGHFATTSDLFEDMTDKYRTIYQHLAGGAQQLCKDSDTPALDLPERRVLEKQEAEASETPAKAEAAAGPEPDEHEPAAAKTEAPETSERVH